MAPHLLSLPLEIRLRILEYALVGPKEFFVCEPSRSFCNFRPIPVPKTKMALELVYKQVLGEMNHITAPKLELRACHLGCAFRWIALSGHQYQGQVSCVRRAYTNAEVRARTNSSFAKDDLSRYIESILELDRAVTGTGPEQCGCKRYDIRGDMKDAGGVDVVVFF